MLQLRPRQTEGDGARRSGKPLLVSIVVHVVVAVVFVRALTLGYSLTTLFERERAPEDTTERIQYVTMPQRGTAATTAPARSGGDGRPETRTPARPLTAPTVVPSTLPPVSTEPAAPSAGGSGAIVGTGGVTRGIQPNYNDPRVWQAPPDRIVTRPKTPQEKLDSTVYAQFRDVADSMETARKLAEGQRKPGDWTVKGKDGGTWGIDQKSIHLGKYSIPNALLALIPSGAIRGNPTEIDRERRLAAIRQDIMLHVNREISEDDFRKSVREIRQRKDRERAAASATVAKRGGGSGSSAP